MAVKQEYSLKSYVTYIANFRHNRWQEEDGAGSIIGHMDSLKIGGRELKPIFKFFNPTSPNGEVPICGMITDISWDKTPGGTLLIRGRIPAKNQGDFNLAVDARDTTPTVEIKFTMYRYDIGTDTYFPCFHTDGKPVKAQLSQQYESKAYDEFAPEYRQIPNHVFTLALVGSDREQQQLHIAYDIDNKVTYKFGHTG